MIIYFLVHNHDKNINLRLTNKKHDGSSCFLFELQFIYHDQCSIEQNL